VIAVSRGELAARLRRRNGNDGLGARACRRCVARPTTADAAIATIAAAATTAHPGIATTATAAATATAHPAIATATAATATAAAATATATTSLVAFVIAIATRLHLGDDLDVVLAGQRLLGDLEQLVLALDMGAVGIGEAVRRVEQRLADVGTCPAVELLGGRGDLALHRDLGRVLGRQGSQLGSELGAAGRQAREHGAFLVEEVAGDGALEVGDGFVDAVDVALVGAAGGQAARGLEEPGHDLVVAAVRALELSEAGQLHTQRGSITQRPQHKRSASLKRRPIAC
jgi:hypothetical protein